MLVDIHPEELKTYILTGTCTQMFLAASVLITKTWKQTGCPSGGGAAKQTVVHPHGGVLRSVRKE